ARSAAQLSPAMAGEPPGKLLQVGGGPGDPPAPPPPLLLPTEPHPASSSAIAKARAALATTPATIAAGNAGGQAWWGRTSLRRLRAQLRAEHFAPHLAECVGCLVVRARDAGDAAGAVYFVDVVARALVGAAGVGGRAGAHDRDRRAARA